MIEDWKSFSTVRSIITERLLPDYDGDEQKAFSKANAILNQLDYAGFTIVKREEV